MAGGTKNTGQLAPCSTRRAVSPVKAALEAARVRPMTIPGRLSTILRADFLQYRVITAGYEQLRTAGLVRAARPLDSVPQ
jgi:hypothetical protein